MKLTHFINITFTTILINFLIKQNYSLKVSNQKDKPILLNVTYTAPMRDPEEMEKYIKEYLSYTKRIKQMERKFIQDIDLIKTLLNIQSMQIDKVNEILHNNLATIYEIQTQKKKNDRTIENLRLDIALRTYKE